MKKLFQALYITYIIIIIIIIIMGVYDAPYLSSI